MLCITITISGRSYASCGRHRLFGRRESQDGWKRDPRELEILNGGGAGGALQREAGDGGGGEQAIG